MTSNVNYNLKVLNLYTNETFWVEKDKHSHELKLKPIPNWHIVGRFVEWIKDLASCGKRSQLVHDLMVQTLKDAYNNNILMIEDPGPLLFLERAFGFRAASRRENWVPITNLTTKILKSKHLKDPEIVTLCNKIAENAANRSEELKEMLWQKILIIGSSSDLEIQTQH